MQHASSAINSPFRDTCPFLLYIISFYDLCFKIIVVELYSNGHRSDNAIICIVCIITHFS